MPLDLTGWVGKPLTFDGLYKISDDLKENRYKQEQDNARKQAQKMATDKFIESTYDPKNLFTGTLEDPNITAGVMDLKNSAYQMSAAGADPNMITLALAGKAKDLADYSEKAKVLGRQWKEAEPLLKGQKGIDLPTAKTEFENMAFRNPDGTIKNPSDIDHQRNYIDEVLRTRPVYNNEGITDFVTNSGKDTRINKIMRTNSKGGSYMTDAELTAPSWMIPEKDGKGVTVGFEPKYEYATGEGEKLMHDFNGTTAPIKIVTDDVFNGLKTTAKAYILQEARKYAQLHGLNASDPQVENFAKAITYDELKNAAKNSTSIKDIVATKENPAPRISIRVNTGGNAANVNPTRDIGSAFDKIQSPIGTVSNGYRKTLNVENGNVTRADGSPFSGELKLPKNEIPDEIRSTVAEASKDNDLPNDDEVSFKVVNGRIQGVLTKKGTWFSRGQETNAQIKKQNTTLPVKNKMGYQYGDKQNTTTKKTTSKGLPILGGN